MFAFLDVPSSSPRCEYLSSRVFPPTLSIPGLEGASWHPVPSLAAALDQGCLLLSTPSSTPITRARPHHQPISSLGKSTFLWGLGGDWLKELSVRWASRKDAARVLGTRSPEWRRSNLPHKQDVPPPIKRGWGWGRRCTALGPHRSRVG